MPAAVGAFLLGEAIASTALFAGLTVGTLVGGAVIIGGSVAISYALAPAARPGQAGSDASRSSVSQASVSDSISPRRRYYGRVKVGGVRAFWDVYNGQLFQILMVNHGEIERFDEFWLGDQIVVTSSGGLGGDVLTEPFYRGGTPAVSFQTRLGKTDQDASGTMRDFWPTTIWTVDHRLRGIAYVVSVFLGVTREEFSEVFQSSFNTPVRVVIYATRVWDPRIFASVYGDQGTYYWTENVGLIILDYLLSVDGLRKPLSQVDIPCFSGFSDRCAEMIARAGNEPERRYRCWGGYDLAEDPKVVLARMLETCAAELYETRDGKIAIRGGGWAEPTVVIDASDIVAISMDRGNSKLAAYNELRVVFTSPDHDFQPIETDPWIDEEAQALQGRIAQDFTVDMCPSWTQARRLAKAKMVKDNPRWKGSLKTKLRGLELLQPQEKPWDLPIFTLRFPELGIDEAFLVTSPITVNNDDTCQMTVQSFSGAFDWDMSEEGVVPPPPQDTRPLT